MSQVRDSDFTGLVDEIVSAPDLRAVLATAVEGLGTLIGANKALAFVHTQDGKLLRTPVEWSSIPEIAETDRIMVRVAAHIQKELSSGIEYLSVSNSRISTHCLAIREDLQKLGINSILAAHTSFKGEPNGCLMVFQYDRLRRWNDSDISLFKFVSYFVGFSIFQHQTLNIYRNSGISYHQLIEQTEAIFFRLRPDFTFRRIATTALRCFGIDKQATIDDMHLLDIVQPSQVAAIRQTLKQSELNPAELELELQIRNQRTKEKNWLLIRLVPIFTDDNVLFEWNGYGVDITSRVEAQKTFERQQKQIALLDRISFALGGALDANKVAEEGLSTLCNELKVSGGMCFLFPLNKDKNLELVSTYGFLKDIIIPIDKQSEISDFCAQVIKQADNLLTTTPYDPRIAVFSFIASKFKSLAVVPIGARHKEVLGALVLFGDSPESIDNEDTTLFGLAGLHIAVAAKQALLFEEYRKQAKRLEALYRMSHELSTNISFEDVIRHSLAVMKEEMNLSKLWLGLIDESGTRLVGQAVLGSGWRSKLVKLNIDISEKNNMMSSILSGRKPLLLEKPAEVFSDMALAKIAERIGNDPMVFVPLFVRGIAMGVLAVQGGKSNPTLDEDELTLLTSMATEMTIVLFARRLEEKVIESERMKTAGLLASGIAHNFNNILQAIIGQASLLELQRATDSVIQKAVGLINEAAMRGATLVRQLSAFTQQDTSYRLACDINELVIRHKDHFLGELDPRYNLTVTSGNEILRAEVDPSQIIRILHELVINAAESMSEGGTIEIITEKTEVTTPRSPHGLPRGRYTVIRVRDYGAGMPPDMLSRCFEPFFTTKNVDSRSGLGMEGNGLGLAVAYILTKRNGGRLIAESALEKGSTFSLFLPLIH